jgi:ComF family protein
MTLSVRTSHIWDQLLPGHCVLCGLLSNTNNLCTSCKAALPRALISCAQCGLPLETSVARLCGDCIRKPPPWDDATAALVYRFPVDHLVKQFKFHRKLACGQILADEIIDAVRQSDSTMPEAIVPVPLYRFREFYRAFNQSGQLARQLGEALRIPVREACLKRIRSTQAHSGLDAPGRRKNIKGAFRCTKPGFSHIAIVDDVMTTGATMAECTRALKSAGVRRVSAWVAARAEGQEPAR